MILGPPAPFTTPPKPRRYIESLISGVARTAHQTTQTMKMYRNLNIFNDFGAAHAFFNDFGASDTFAAIIPELIHVLSYGFYITLICILYIYFTPTRVTDVNDPDFGEI